MQKHLNEYEELKSISKEMILINLYMRRRQYHDYLMNRIRMHKCNTDKEYREQSIREECSRYLNFIRPIDEQIKNIRSGNNDRKEQAGKEV